MPIYNVNKQTEDGRLPIQPSACHRFYEPIVILLSLYGPRTQSNGRSSSSPSEDLPPPKNDKEFLQTFLNKLAHVCDSQRWGKTVTSFALLFGRSADVEDANRSSVEYCFTSNNRTEDEFRQTTAYVRNLLDCTREYLEQGQPKNYVRRRLLFQVLRFNRPKISLYVKQLGSAIEDCIEACDDSKEDVLVSSTIQKILPKVDDFVTTVDNLEQSDSRSSYILCCADLISSLVSVENSSIPTIMKAHIPDGDLPGTKKTNSWASVLHLMKRILAYPQSVMWIIHTYTIWPEIFRDFQIRFIPSSIPVRMMSKVRQKSLDAESIINRMTNDPTIYSSFKSYVETLQKFELNNRIKEEYDKISKDSKFSVHAEVHLTDWLVKNGGLNPSRFFLNLPYVSSSKPTCKLCDYYFKAYGDQVGHRESHGNLYVRWRLPDLLATGGEVARLEAQRMFTEVIRLVREEAFELITSKAVPSRKSHDSNTFSAGVRLDSRWSVHGSDTTSLSRGFQRMAL